jgi:hypothetical protein
MARRRLTRRWLLAGAAAALAACAGFWAVLPPDPLETARGRVPLRADPEAVEAAVGRPADFSGRQSAVADDPRRVLGWLYDEDQLLVRFDRDGRAIKADADNWRDRTPWERFLAWLRSED